jgi:hypothetical protein
MRASGYDRVASDWYVEPRWSIDALLDAETFPGLSWDPSCGGGNIPTALKNRGMDCLASDISDRGYGEVLDFFQATRTVDNIITNPPYALIEPYIKHALTLATRKVAILARLALLEGIKRRELFRNTPLATVWISSRRISMPPGGTSIEARGGSIAYAWFVWDNAHAGAASIGWI